MDGGGLQSAWWTACRSWTVRCHSQRFRASEEITPFLSFPNGSIGNPVFKIRKRNTKAKDFYFCLTTHIVCFSTKHLRRLEAPEARQEPRAMPLLLRLPAAARRTRSVFLDEAPLETHAPEVRLVIVAEALLLRFPAHVVRTRSVFFRHSKVVAKVTGSVSSGNSRTVATSKVSGHGPPKNHRVFAKSSDFSPSPPPLSPQGRGENKRGQIFNAHPLDCLDIARKVIQMK